MLCDCWAIFMDEVIVQEDIVEITNDIGFGEFNYPGSGFFYIRYQIKEYNNYYGERVLLCRPR